VPAPAGTRYGDAYYAFSFFRAGRACPRLRRLMTRNMVTELGDSPALPRLHAQASPALSRLYDHGPDLPLVLPSITGPINGPINARLRAVYSPSPERGVGRHGRFRLRVGPHSATLALDSVGLSALTGEARCDLLPPELRTILLADALHPATQALQDRIRQPIEWLDAVEDSPPATPPPANPLCFRVLRDDGSVAVQGHLQFDDPQALDALVPRFDTKPGAPIPAAFDRLRMPLRFEIGASRLQLQEVRSIAPGDIVGIEHWRSQGPALYCTASLVRAHERARAPCIHALAEGSRITVQSLGGALMAHAESPAAAAPDDAASNLPLDRLDALEVTLRFEVGELALTLGELKTLKPGHVFELSQPLNRSAVRILAHGNVLGNGHLVAVGERLGVRISTFAAGEL
jgi:type III secretion protein Q